jgi:eukaryotic-like serine/threonine-protein kinase
MRGPLRPADPRWVGRYRLEARLGQGGMGTVYLGRGQDGRAVAIKVIKPEFADDDEFRGRFRSEVNRARAVPPFCTAEVLDADAGHDPPYLVTEYVDGPSLAEVVADQGPLTGGNLYSVAVGVATALAAIHGAGVIHRDLKPRNVLFALGSPKVIDFGIARAFEATSQHTATDQMVGTVAYMAPERFDTETDRAVGPAADVFAWGVVVTYAGTGRTPFSADSPVATAAGILTQPPRLGDLPEPLRDLVAAALRKDPSERPSAAQLIDLLLAAGAQEGLAARPELGRAARAAQHAAPPAAYRPADPPATSGSQSWPPGASPAGDPKRRRRLVPALAGLAVVVVAGSAALAFTPARDLLPTREPAAVDTDGPVAAGALPSVVPSLSDPASPSAVPSSAAPSRRVSPSESATVRPAGGGRTVTVGPASPPPAVRRCGNGDIKVSISAQNDDPTAIGAQRGLISVANQSRTDCRVDGRAFITLYNAADEQVSVPTQPVEEPGPAIDIVLKPGGGAFQGMKWQACDTGDADCPTGNTLRGSLTSSSEGVVAELEGFPSPERSQIAMSSLQLGTLQPSTEGVVAW